MGLLIEDRHPRHVTGQHIGRELDAVEAAADRAGDALRQHRLPGAWNIFDENMPLAEQADKRQSDGLSLPNDDAFYVFDHLL